MTSKYHALCGAEYTSISCHRCGVQHAAQALGRARNSIRQSVWLFQVVAHCWTVSVYRHNDEAMTLCRLADSAPVFGIAIESRGKEEISRSADEGCGDIRRISSESCGISATSHLPFEITNLSLHTHITQSPCLLSLVVGRSIFTTGCRSCYLSPPSHGSLLAYQPFPWLSNGRALNVRFLFSIFPSSPPRLPRPD